MKIKHLDLFGQFMVIKHLKKACAKYFVHFVKSYTFATEFCVLHGIIGDRSPLFYY